MSLLYIDSILDSPGQRSDGHLSFVNQIFSIYKAYSDYQFNLLFPAHIFLSFYLELLIRNNYCDGAALLRFERLRSDVTPLRGDKDSTSTFPVFHQINSQKSKFEKCLFIMQLEKHENRFDKNGSFLSLSTLSILLFASRWSQSGGLVAICPLVSFFRCCLLLTRKIY